MDAKDALEWVERLVHNNTGKYLNDLERKVFVGSWNGQTYEDIYPENPEYVEKSVGFRLWQKLSKACGEKVTKKQLQGALERAIQRYASATESTVASTVASSTPSRALTQQRVFISYRHQEPDLSLAQQFSAAIAASGHQVFMTTAKDSTSTHTHQNWLSHIDAGLQQCDYFLLLLSPQAAVSEMVIEELRRAHSLHQRSSNASEARLIPHKPIILPIRVNCQPDTPLNHDLRSYLQDIPQLEWSSPANTAGLIQAVLNCLNHDEAWGGGEVGRWGEMGAREQGGQAHIPFVTPHSSPLTPHSSPLTPHSSLFTPHPSLLTPHPSLLTPHSSLLTPHPSLPTPLPVADPELPQGQVRLHSAFYIERVPYEAQCYREILQPGTLIRVKAPRQMGKTSLMSRILYQAREQGYHTVPLSFQHADVGVFSSLDQLLQWFCSKVARKLRLPHQIDQYWTDTYGSKDNCTMYFEDCLLSQVDSPLVLGLDEVDRIFQYPQIADDFFGLLRAWYEEAGYGGSDSSLWEKLRLIVVHSTEVYVPLDINQSPFNVGLPIELSEFSATQVFDLAQRHQLDWQSPQVEQLMAIAGGHPYLVRLALYHLAQQSLTLNDLMTTAPTEAGIYGDHLRRHLWNLQHHPELSNAFGRVVTSNEPVELESILAFKLHSLGLVQLQGNDVTPRFELYRQYFSERL